MNKGKEGNANKEIELMPIKKRPASFVSGNSASDFYKVRSDSRNSYDIHIDADEPRPESNLFDPFDDGFNDRRISRRERKLYEYIKTLTPDERRQAVEEYEKKRKKTKFHVIFFIILGIIIAGAIFSFAYYFRINNFEIEGNTHFSDEDIILMSKVEPGTHFLQLKNNRIEELIDSEPRLTVKQITYKAPDTLYIEVEEHDPVASIPYGSSYIIISSEGRSLGQYAESEGYPQVYGVELSSAETGKKVESDDTFRLEQLRLIVSSLESHGEIGNISGINLLNTSHIFITCSNGIEIVFGGYREDYDELTVKMHKVLEALAKEGMNAGTVDISYNDFAIFKGRSDKSEDNREVRLNYNKKIQAFETENGEN